jgi:glutamine synthetase
MPPEDVLVVEALSNDPKVALSGQPLTADEVLERVRSGEISTVITGGCDTNGVYRAKRVPAERFATDGEVVVEFSEYMWIMDLDQVPQPAPAAYKHWWPTWETGFGDIEAVADLSTLRIVPWLDRTAAVLCDYRHTGGRGELALAPRNVLRRVLDRYEELGLTPRMAVEFEFHVLRETEETAVAKHFRDLQPLSPTPSAYSALQGTLDDRVIGRMAGALLGLRLAIDTWAPEGGPGQYELNLAHEPVLEAADQGFLFKHAVKELCALDDMTACFMPKLHSEGFGSSMHVHQSLWRDGESAFHDADAADGMSATLRHFLAGQFKALPELACLFLPTPNAYKRVTPHTAAGSTQTWSGDNKTVSLRVLTHGAGACRVEHRVPGADANVYLALAGMLASGLYGIERQPELAPPTHGDAYTDPSAPGLPGNLERAAEALLSSDVAREYLGDEFVDYYASTRLWEVEQFAAAITDWELARYLVRG